MKITLSRLSLSLLAVLFAAPSFAADNLAVVNGKAIPQSRAEAVIAEQKAQGPPDSEQLRAAIKERLIVNRWPT